MAYNFSDKETYDLIPEGDYEVVLSTAEIRETNDKSKKFISCKYTIRTDVDQASAGRVIFENIWQDRNDPEDFDHKKLQKILLTQGPNGKYIFNNDIDLLIQHINGLNMIIHISKKDADEYHSEAYNEVKYCSHRPSKAQPKTLAGSTPTVSVSANYDFSGEDLPF